MFRWLEHRRFRRLVQPVRKEGEAAPDGRGARGVEGSALVELALSSVILFAMLAGITQISTAFYAYHVTADAARKATRWAIVRGSTSCTNTPNLSDCNATAAQIQSFVAGLGYLNIGTSNVTVNWLAASATQPTTWSTCTSAPCNIPGNVAQVVVTYPLSLNIPFVPKQTFSVSSTSQMVIAQ
jgi:Flp pilus assembly protein TadG